MNPRVQVEHTVTEMVTGIDIVQTQILVAQGYALDSDEIQIPSQESVETTGYAIQTRITTEDPSNNFLPDTGKITVYRSGAGNGIRLDGGNAYAGAEITPYYDSLLVKACSHDRTFLGAVMKSTRVLKETRIRGIKTNIPFLINVLNHETFKSGQCYTTFIEDTPELFLFAASQDRATKILEFLGNKMVNEQKAEEKPFFEDRVLPKYDKKERCPAVFDGHPYENEGSCRGCQGIQPVHGKCIFHGSVGRSHIRYFLPLLKGISVGKTGTLKRKNAEYPDSDASSGVQCGRIQELSGQCSDNLYRRGGIPRSRCIPYF